MSMQWLLTAVFACTGMYGLIRTGAPGSWADRVSRAGHVLMCADMAVMPWIPMGRTASAFLVALFGGAGAWYLARSRRVAAPSGVPLAGPGHRPGRRHQQLGLWCHAGMMFGMVWMTALMSFLSAGEMPTMAGGTVHLSGGGAHLGGVHGVAGTDRSVTGGTTPTATPASGAAATGGPSRTTASPATSGQTHRMSHPTWSRGISLAFGVSFAAMTAWFLTTARRPRGAGENRRTGGAGENRRTGGVADSISNGLMAAGMAASLLLMV